MELPCKIPYKTKWSTILGCGGLFAAGGVFMAHLASTNEKGAVIYGIIHLSPAQATVFYWIITAMSGLFVIAAVLLAAARIAEARYLELTADAILLPGGFLRTKVRHIPYASIMRVSETTVHGHDFLNLHTPEKKHEIVAAMLPDEEEYTKLKKFLMSAVGQHETGIF